MAETYRDGRYMSLHDKGTINIIEDEERGYRVGFEIDGIKFSGEDLEQIERKSGTRSKTRSKIGDLRYGNCKVDQYTG